MSDIEKLMGALMAVQINEKKKLDPVGKEDDDIDNDGDVDSSDSYLKNRRKKVGQAIAKDKEQKEGKIPPQFLKNIKKKKGDDEDDDDKDDDDKKPDFLKKKEKKEGYGKKKKMSEAKVECPKCKGDGCSHCDDKGYHMKEDVEMDSYVEALQQVGSKDVQELSTKTMTSYISKASDASKHKGMSTAKQDKRYKGVATASKKVDKKLSMEQTLASIKDEDRKVMKWSQFSEDYDEFTFKGKKRPQDRPLGKSDEKPAPSAEFDKHTKGSTPPEGMFDKESEKSKAFIKMHQQSDSKWEDLEDEGHEDVSKAGRAVKSQSPNRMGRDNRSGDTNIINKPTQKF